MLYFLIDEKLGKYVEVDETTNFASVLARDEVQKELDEATVRLKEIPPAPTDKELLAWAKENYPMVDYSAEIAHLEQIVTVSNTRLEGMK